jgi:adenylate cyclase
MALRRHPWHFRAVALLLAGALALLVQWLAPSVLAAVEEMAGDLSWRVGASAQPERRVVIVDIDEASLKETGPWPWPRTKTAELADRIHAAGATLQVYDIGFSDAKEGDLRLAESWARSAVVVGQVFSLDSTVTPETGLVAGRLAQSGCPGFAPNGFGAYGTAADLLAAGPAVGHMTPRIEQDGVVRHLPAIVCHRGAAYPTLSLAALWRVVQPDVGVEAGQPAGRPVPTPDWQWHRASEQGLTTSWFAPAAWLTSASLPGTLVPLDDQGNLRVPYRIDRRAFASIPAARVLRGDKDLALLKGAIVLIGSTAFGVGDVVATPHAAVAAGLEVHAQTLAGLLDRRLPFEPRHSGVLQTGAVLLGAALLLLVSGRPGGRAVRRLPAAGLLGAGLMGLGAAWALMSADLWLPWALPALFMLLASGALAAAEHAQTLLQRERLSAHLGSYLPQPVAQRLMGIDPTGNVQVEQRDVSVLVADIRNFSAFAAHRPAEETVALLHAFSSIAVDVVERHGGVVERVAGDSVLAVWNAFSACESHAQRAMDAARELVSATRSLLASNTPEGDDGLVQPLALGIGLEAGNAIVGSFGPTRRRAHAALGEPVSVASRIQQMTTDLSVPILVGPRMASSLKADATESLGEYLLEGLGRHYQLFVPVAWAELVPVDPGWASAATSSDRNTESGSWTRWSQSALLTAAPSNLLRSRTSLSPRDV